MHASAFVVNRQNKRTNKHEFFIEKNNLGNQTIISDTITHF